MLTTHMQTNLMVLAYNINITVDLDDIEKVLPGKLKEVFEFLRDYKIPDGKPPNKFAYNDQPKDKVH